jgi:hypothetical protein
MTGNPSRGPTPVGQLQDSHIEHPASVWLVIRQARPAELSTPDVNTSGESHLPNMPCTLITLAKDL